MKNAMKKAAAIAFCLAAISSNGLVQKATAEEAPKSIPFTVVPVLPQNQNSKVKGYFDLDVKANQEQTLKFKVINNQNSEINLNLEVANAVTSSNGGVEYVNASSEENKKMIDGAYAFANIAKTVSGVKIAPKGTADVAVSIKTPNFSEGTLLGGVIFYEKEAGGTQGNQTQNDVSLQIKNRVSFIMAVQLDFPAKKAPSIGVGEASVAYWPAGPQVLVPIRNEAAALAENMTGKYAVSDENGNEIFRGNFNSMSMAPKTQIEYPVPWNSEKIAPGKYKAELKFQLGTTEIKETKPFEITKSLIVQYQNDAIKKPTIEIPEENAFPVWEIWLVVGIFVAALLLFAIRAFAKK